MIKNVGNKKIQGTPFDVGGIRTINEEQTDLAETMVDLEDNYRNVISVWDAEMDREEKRIF